MEREQQEQQVPSRRGHWRRNCESSSQLVVQILEHAGRIWLILAFRSNLWEETEMMKDGSVLGCASNSNPKVQKGWILLSEGAQLRKASFKGDFWGTGTDFPGFEIECEDGHVSHFAVKHQDQAQKWIDKIGEWCKETTAPPSSTAAKMAAKYSIEAPSSQAGCRSTGMPSFPCSAANV